MTAVAGGGTQLHGDAGRSHGSTAAAHAAGALVYHLQRLIVMIVPFVNGFFGSPASGDL